MSATLEPSRTGLPLDARELREAVVQHRHAVARGEQELEGWTRAAAMKDRGVSEMLAAIRTRLAGCSRLEERAPRRRGRPTLRLVTGDE